MSLSKEKQKAFNAFREAVHVKYLLGPNHPDGLLPAGDVRICSRAHANAEAGSEELLNTSTEDLLKQYMDEDIAWRARTPRIPSAIHTL